MDSAGKNLTCVVVTPERALLNVQADFVAVPMLDGELGVLSGRAPLMGRLGMGELRIRQDGNVQRFFVEGGFVQIKANVVTVLTSRAQRGQDIDAVKVSQALEANSQPAFSLDAQEKRKKDQERARVQLRILRHQRGADSA